jgi:hypothetical protein
MTRRYSWGLADYQLQQIQGLVVLGFVTDRRAYV